MSSQSPGLQSFGGPKVSRKFSFGVQASPAGALVSMTRNTRRYRLRNLLLNSLFAK
jgi:hypothetical protein